MDTIVIKKNRNLLHQISAVITELNASFCTDHIVVGSDFNLTPDEWKDRWPSKLLSEYRNPILEEFVNNDKLIFGEIYTEMLNNSLGINQTVKVDHILIIVWFQFQFQNMSQKH